MNFKEEYDLICSLGGNCSAAHNLLIRRLREEALPFDWCYCTSDEAIYTLIDGFKTKFSKYLQKENLIELSVNPSHPDKIQYEDSYGKIIWANHFSKKIDQNNEYEKIKKKFNRRFNRLLKLVYDAEKILFVFSASFEIQSESFELLLTELNKMYPNKKFNIKAISFSCQNDEIIEKENLIIYRYKRQMNEYDYIQTNTEWSFLDNVKKRIRNSSFYLHKIKKGIHIAIFPKINTLLYLKIYLFGLRLHITLGKNRFE